MKLRTCFVLALAPACRSLGSYDAPAPNAPAAWAEAASAAGTSPPVAEWWREFHDATLDALVARALAQNLDLALARARVLEARAVRDAADGGDALRVDGTAGYTRARRSANEQPAFGPRESDLWRAGFDARWELDLFGRNDAQVAAAEAGVDAAVEAQRDAAVVLLGELARNYVELRGAQQSLAVARANLASQRDTAELTNARFQAGIASELDLERARAQASNTEAQLPAFDAAVRTSAHRIAILLGEEPGARLAELADASGSVPPAPEVIATGLPADLLRRRSDVRRAERELARECALGAAARAELYPRLSLGATWGQRANHGADLFDSASNSWSFGPSLVLPLFEGGVLRANVRAQDARAEQALVRWQQAVLRAQAEVADAITLLSRERERNVSLANALVSQRRSVALANDLFTRGLVDFFQVLDAQRAQFQIESDLAQSTTRAATSAVALYKALGGGWETLAVDAGALGEPLASPAE